MRVSTLPTAYRPVLYPLLSHRDAVHPLRHRSGVSVSMGSRFQDVKLVRLLEHSDLHLRFGCGIRLRLAKGCVSVGVVSKVEAALIALWLSQRYSAS